MIYDVFVKILLIGFSVTREFLIVVEKGVMTFFVYLHVSLQSIAMQFVQM